MKLNTTTIKIGLLTLSGLLSAGAFAQTKKTKQFGPQENGFINCATTQYEESLQRKFPNRSNTVQFEEWIAQKIEEQKAKGFLKNTQTTNEVVTIPVVFHVIHDGDAIGQNENIADEQILSQLTVLNQDFRRMADTPGFNTNPVGADMEIEFCLAQRDEYGIATSGITRHYYENDDPYGWEMNAVETIIKPQTQWDPNKYLNIWVVSNLYISFNGTPIGELAGYAQFPTQSGLEGLEEEGLPVLAETDGVALGAMYCGSSDIYPNGYYNEEGGKDKGRSASHEVGHYFGLRHIWGDGDCSFDDYCADTPVAENANSGCPEGLDSCPSSPGLDMIENYMDYTNDSCQNVFTQNQKERMQAVLANSPRRVSLITSDGCVPGVVYDNDGSLNINQLQQSCGEEFALTINLKNTGTNTITAAEISYTLDEEAAVYSWTGELENGETTTIELPVAEPAQGEHTLELSIISVNNTEDEAPLNDTITQDFTYTPVASYNTQALTVTILTDGWGDETLWAVLDANEELITYGGPYDDDTLYTETVELEISQCYTFVIIDQAGDGMCCEYGEGYYEVTTIDGTVVASGGSFGVTEETSFYVDTTLGTNDFVYENGIKLYPNPTNGIINISMKNNELPESYTIYNNLGQVVAQSKVSSTANLSINTSAYSNGIYFIKIDKDGQSATLKFIKN
ncbi:T9SS type A sorting domain-containing protein [Flavobacterium beibuense]|uniref:Por secretion system C-terminal sorting domain containing protein n=1 Tax=Flavobacterium beibuense TaxID=657326 RepID=A0A444WBY8_9FLAO|nr:T9SS type A sorting domain-containing protein [Flavobacterium beibuense]RYJ43254.1 Por secretion system C-terminal sorting domain containing protein [Flavobacterium beibuense]